MHWSIDRRAQHTYIILTDMPTGVGMISRHVDRLFGSCRLLDMVADEDREPDAVNNFLDPRGSGRPASTNCSKTRCGGRFRQTR